MIARLRAAACAVGLAACDGKAPDASAEPQEPDRATAVAAAEARAEANRTASPGPSTPAPDEPSPRTGVAPQVLLVWDNIGDLYQSFFSKVEPVSKLSEDLTGYVNGPVNIHIRWDQERFLGTIRLRVLPGTLIDPQLGAGNTVPLQALAPLTAALATYRSDVANRFDVRVASFRIAVESFAGARHCVFSVAGTPPPDGRLVSPCVQLNGQERCGSTVDDGVVFPTDVAADLRACLTPKG